MKKLTLKKESIADLATDELTAVVGGEFPTFGDCVTNALCPDTGGPYPTGPLKDCLRGAWGTR